MWSYYLKIGNLVRNQIVSFLCNFSHGGLQCQNARRSHLCGHYLFTRWACKALPGPACERIDHLSSIVVKFNLG